ncbi:integrase [Streptomyces sp. KMM 9044]|uniref:integrase n=2 Tax=Streptomyces sp. KMM 9044 TaxID=2744474 RepID=UPI00215147DF|nr:integrase [Streptomyces sp. KMM 9044]WAX76998.1 integrase [Streptomyces sp. KMM 9044]
MRRSVSASLPRHRRAIPVFAQVDVCEIAGLRLAEGAMRPRFEQDRWVFSGLVDAHRMMTEREQIWDFTEIINPQWRVVAKEILLAMLAPQYEAVLECAHALRAARSPRTLYGFLEKYIEWFNWLTEKGITSLRGVSQELCERYLEERSWSVPRLGRHRRRLEPYSTVAHVRILKLIAQYEELLSGDGYDAGFVPWKGKTATQVVGYKSKGPNLTPPVPDSMLQPLLATCLHLVNDVGPHLVDLMETVSADRAALPTSGGVTLAQLPALRQVLERMRTSGAPLPAVDDAQLRKRTTLGEEGPLKHLGWEALARTVGARRFGDDARQALIPELTALAAEVGFQPPLARQAAGIPRVVDGELVPWTLPLADGDLFFMVDHAVTACLVVTCALSGMRTSELLELEAGSRLPAVATPGGGPRFRLASRLIKGQKFGGVPDEWVVIEQVDRSVALAERLVNRSAGEALFGTIDLAGRLRNLRGWLERTGNRERWGLPVIPQGPLSARMLRRTLSLAIAERPGGLLAAKVALKHISVATTEGYAARPGGSQRLFHAEVEEAEEAHHVQLTVEAFRDVQAGRMPAGPGARSLIEAFHHVDAQLKNAARTDPKILKDDRHLEGLLRKQASTLHVGPANFCWFRDPSKALCLRLAGTPNATKPLVGMCDSARCPQATHHPCHRPVWAGQATAIDVFIQSPRVAKGEKARLTPERDRALRVVAEIDAAQTVSIGED